MSYLSWYSHRNGFHFPLMEFVESTEDQQISNFLKDGATIYISLNVENLKSPKYQKIYL